MLEVVNLSGKNTDNYSHNREKLKSTTKRRLYHNGGKGGGGFGVNSE